MNKIIKITLIISIIISFFVGFVYWYLFSYRTFKTYVSPYDNCIIKMKTSFVYGSSFDYKLIIYNPNISKVHYESIIETESEDGLKSIIWNQDYIYLYFNSYEIGNYISKLSLNSKQNDFIDIDTIINEQYNNAVMKQWDKLKEEKGGLLWEISDFKWK